MKGTSINICTDNQITLNTLTANHFESKLVWKCLNNVIQLAMINRVTIV